ncbi:MAG TPA: hypothetical protein VK509_09465 [Polyangiales bacterium]|nr:hypothetical protein [Polyangiales bacterium]
MSSSVFPVVRLPASMRELREVRLKPAHSRVAYRARQRAALTQTALAKITGIQQSHIARVEARGEPHSYSSLHIMAAGADARTLPFAQELAADLCDYVALQAVPRAEDVHGEEHLARLAAVIAEVTDVPRALSSALAANDRSAARLEELRSEIKGGIRALLELDQWSVRTIAARRKAG